MLNLRRLDVVQCSTPLEVELLAALVRERRLRMMGVGIKPLRRPDVVPPVLIVPVVPEPPTAPIDLIPAGTASVSQIQSVVSKHFGFTVHDIKADRRQAKICLARHVAVLLCHALTLYSYPHLGRYFHRDHSTLLNSVDKMRWLETELRSELSPDDPLGLWSRRAFEKTVPKPVDKPESAPVLQPAVA